MDRRTRVDRRTQAVVAVLALVVVFAAAFGLSFTQRETVPEAKRDARAKAETGAAEDACASTATYARLKEVAFEQAIKARNADPANLDTLAATSVVRMENPVVKSRDTARDVTVCAGTFILELPPGAEAAFGGERRLTAEIEYAAQKAADGSGLVYSITGAQPIVTRLAAFDLNRAPAPMPGMMPADVAAPPAAAPGADFVTLGPGSPGVPNVRTVGVPPTPERNARRSSRPSFDCRDATTRGERMVCASDSLASRDRQMASRFYAAMSGADGPTRRRLRSTRDAFLAYRDRCRDDACVAEAYDGRMREIQDIAFRGD